MDRYELARGSSLLFWAFRMTRLTDGHMRDRLVGKNASYYFGDRILCCVGHLQPACHVACYLSTHQPRKAGHYAHRRPLYTACLTSHFVLQLTLLYLLSPSLAASFRVNKQSIPATSCASHSFLALLVPDGRPRNNKKPITHHFTSMNDQLFSPA